MDARVSAVVGLVGFVLLVLPAAAQAEDASAPPYKGGTILESSALTGDWRGARNDLAAKGITLDANVTQVTQGVVSGGKNSEWVYGGRGDLTGNLDTQKLGLWPGGFLRIELEGNWGDSVNTKTGALLPANANQLFPVPFNDNVALPDLSFAQFLSHYFGLMAGKIQVISDGDLNVFAHGKGATQFLNVAFNVNPVLFVVPYSTLGAGGIILPTGDPTEAILKLFAFSPMSPM